MSGWDPVLEAIGLQAPWRWAHEDGYFAFAGGDLDDAVGLFVGDEGGAPGFLLFPTFDALARFAAGPQDQWAEVDHLALHLLPRDDGASFAPRLVAVDGGHVRPAVEAENARTLRALGATVELCRRDRGAVADGTPAACERVGSDGTPIRVVWAVEDPDLFPFATHRLEVPADGPRLVLTVEADDLARARQVLDCVAEVRAVRTGDGLVLQVPLGGHGAGALSVFDPEDADAIALLLARAGRIDVWLGAGDTEPERVAGLPCRVT